MSKAKKRKKAPPPQTNNCHNLTRPLALAEDDAELLLYLVSAYDPRHWMAKTLAFMLRQFADDALKLKELEARVRTNAFWDDDKNEPARAVKAKVKELRKGKKAREKELVAKAREIACLEPPEIIKLLNQPKGANDGQEADLAE